jgi:uncharacterized protein
VRIGVVGDTHLPRFGRALPRALIDGLAGVDRILHVGDHTTALATELLAGIAPVDAVAGNNDPAELQERFGTWKVVEIEGVKLGLVHGHLGAGRSTLDRALGSFQPYEADVVLFGHSHIPYLARHEDRWVMNPGSPTDKRRQPRYSYGTVEISGGEVWPRLHHYDDRST